MQKNLKALFGEHHGLDDKSVNFLTKALANNNLPGFDYLEFKQSLGALADLDMDEATAIKSAFATAATLGLTKEKLVKSAEHYKNILNTEKAQFDAALQKQIQQKVASKQKEVQKLKAQVEEYRKKIQQLEEKIMSSQRIIDSADETISAAKQKIDGTRDNFETALKAITNQINMDIENIQNFL